MTIEIRTMGIFEKEVDIEEKVLETIESNSEYSDTLQVIVDYEEDNKGKHDKWDDRSQYNDTAWSVADLPIRLNPGKLGYLKQQGIVESVMKTNNSNINNLWALTDRETTKEALKIDKAGDVATVDHDDTIDEDIPDDIFEPIVGHEDIKELFLASLHSDDPVHILLLGPPASGKTVFLEEVKRIQNAEFLVGSSTTGPGLLDELFENRPKHILIDEFDKMDKSDYGNLLSLQESGLVKETKGNEKRREMKLRGATIYGSANRLENVPDENLSRFLGDPVIELEQYNDEEFKQVVENVLVMREDAEVEIAKLIADIISERTGVRDFRECRRIYRLASSRTESPDKDDVVKYVDIIGDYSSQDLL